MSDAMMARTAYATGTSQTIDTLHVRTDSTGTASFRYVASQFGGVERIRARLLSDTTKWDTLSVKTRVPGLMLLPEGNDYIKIGGTCRHHGPSDNSEVPDSCRSPDNNHWGTSRLVQAIQAIASAYDSLHRRVRLRVNDMSLPYGGLFDIAGNWLPSHHEHRIGINADFSLKCRDSTNNLVNLKEEDFSRITWERTGLEPLRHYPPGQPHYHIYVRED